MRHDNCGDIICSHYDKLSSLLIERNGFMSTTFQNPVKDLFDIKRKEKEQSGINKEDNQSDCDIIEVKETCNECSFFPQSKPIGFKDIEICKVKKVLRLIISGIPLTWNQRGYRLSENSKKRLVIKEIWDDCLPTYEVSHRLIPILYNNTKVKVKQYVKQLKYYSLICDGYSIPSK